LRVSARAWARLSTLDSAEKLPQTFNPTPTFSCPDGS
jgi:hypothetical protein